MVFVCGIYNSVREKSIEGEITLVLSINSLATRGVHPESIELLGGLLAIGRLFPS